jgi:phosphohistidine phosphatase
MDLVLWRHAEAIDLELVGDDMLRTLTPRGDKQARRMGTWLDRHLPSGTKVFASPALRADHTARALDRKYKTSAALAPLANAQDLLGLVHWPHANGCVLVVGHQPTLGQVIAQVLGFPEQACAIRKGSVWWLRYRERERELEGETVVVSVQSADLL